MGRERNSLVRRGGDRIEALQQVKNTIYLKRCVKPRYTLSCFSEWICVFFSQLRSVSASVTVSAVKENESGCDGDTGK